MTFARLKIVTVIVLIVHTRIFGTMTGPEPMESGIYLTPFLVKVRNNRQRWRRGSSGKMDRVMRKREMLAVSVSLKECYRCVSDTLVSSYQMFSNDAYVMLMSLLLPSMYIASGFWERSARERFTITVGEGERRERS